MAQEEDGTVRRLLPDPEMADQVTGAIGSLSETSNELNATIRSVRRVVGEVESGDGTAPEVIYGSQGVQLLANVAIAASEIATLLRDVRTGDNDAHELLCGDEAGDLITNLTAMSVDLRTVVADVRAGRGTIGGCWWTRRSTRTSSVRSATSSATRSWSRDPARGGRGPHE